MRFIARYAKDNINEFEIITVFDSRVESISVNKSTPKVKSLFYEYPASSWFERKIHDDFGIEFEESYDQRPLVWHERFPANCYPLQKSFTKKEIAFSDYKPYPYEVVEGDGVFQVSVGPIHAGIIESGHFHFSQSGERMLHQEIRHFYKNRGIEKMLEGKSLEEAKPIVARISGNESIAYQLCLNDILFQSSHKPIPLELQKYHALLLELERVVHHLTDLGFIPNDTGFASALAYCSKLSEDTRRWLKRLTGHRFGFGAITTIKPSIDIKAFKSWLEEMKKAIKFFESWILEIPSLLDRLEGTGILSKEEALTHSAVGIIARASGVAVDRREESAFYQEHGFTMTLKEKGDVYARFTLRIDEVKNSILLIENLLEEGAFEADDLGILEDGTYRSFCESSIGELFMSIEIQSGVIERFYVRDPSFVNWQLMHLMMRSDIIADFPLINKSCDLSYAGSDL